MTTSHRSPVARPASPSFRGPRRGALSALAPWYGSKRSLAPWIEESLRPCKSVWDLFCGSFAVVMRMDDVAMRVANDLHGDGVNLARCLADPKSALSLYRRASRVIMCEGLFRDAASRLAESPSPCPDAASADATADESPSPGPLFGPAAPSRKKPFSRVLSRTLSPAGDGAVALDVERALDFLIVSWQGRNGVSGTEDFLAAGAPVSSEDATEATDAARGLKPSRSKVFASSQANGGLNVRYQPHGGSMGRRWAKAADSIPEWHQRLRGVTILSRDAFSLLDQIDDVPGQAVYLDPPYLAKSRTYRHDFTPGDHERLAAKAARFQAAKIVVSYYDDPRLADLYPEDRWERRSRPVRGGMANANRGGATGDVSESDGGEDEGEGEGGDSTSKRIEVLLINRRDERGSRSRSRSSLRSRSRSQSESRSASRTKRDLRTMEGGPDVEHRSGGLDLGRGDDGLLF